MLKYICIMLWCILNCTVSTAFAETLVNSPQNISPKDALTRLMEGNQRFSKDKSVCLTRNQSRRTETIAKQLPFAIVLGCSDSRVPPEIAFDQGIGDIFVVRVAGNVVSDIELSSIEYSAAHNHSAIILVMGHQNCGAVDAVVQNQAGDMPKIAKLIEPSVKVAQNQADFTLEKAIKANVLNSVRRVKASPIIHQLMQENKIGVVGGYYNLNSGKVELLNNL